METVHVALKCRHQTPHGPMLPGASHLFCYRLSFIRGRNCGGVSIFLNYSHRTALLTYSKVVLADNKFVL